MSYRSCMVVCAAIIIVVALLVFWILTLPDYPIPAHELGKNSGWTQTAIAAHEVRLITAQTLAGLLTVVSAGLAAYFASEASKEAKRTNDLNLTPYLAINRFSIFLKDDEAPPRFFEGAEICVDAYLYPRGVGEVTLRQSVMEIFIGDDHLPMRSQSPIREKLRNVEPKKLKRGAGPGSNVMDECIQLTDTAVLPYWDGSKRLYVLGEAKYTTPFGHLRHLGFARVYCHEEARFKKVDNPDYEFDEY